MQNNNQPKLEDDILNQIKSFHIVVEQMIATQEIINKLEPIIQSLREPEFMLFPFLFQGMFGFGELVVDPDSSRSRNENRNSEGNNKEDELREEKNKSKNKIVHFQGHIPLPSLGMTSFEAFYSDDKIDIFFSLSDDDKIDFLSKRTEEFKKYLGRVVSREVNIETKKAGDSYKSLPLDLSSLDSLPIEVI